MIDRYRLLHIIHRTQRLHMPHNRRDQNNQTFQPTHLRPLSATMKFDPLIAATTRRATLHHLARSPPSPAHRARLYEYSSSIFWLIQSTTELKKRQVSPPPTLPHIPTQEERKNEEL